MYCFRIAWLSCENLAVRDTIKLITCYLNTAQILNVGGLLAFFFFLQNYNSFILTVETNYRRGMLGLKSNQYM